MSDAFYVAASGMQVQQLSLDTIANNVANVNTMGYKKDKVSFSDMVVQTAGPAVGPQADALTPAQSTGVGVGMVSVTKQFDAGDLKSTGAQFDVAIQGDGFFEVAMGDGTSAFTRGGSFKLNDAGQLCTQSGLVLKPGVTIPDNVQSVTIASDGSVRYTLAGQSAGQDAGQLQLVRFANTEGLGSEGDGLYLATALSGEAIAGQAGQDGLGTLVQGALEGSNVKLIDEMVNMMIAQRGYEASLKVVQASDELAGMANSMRK